MRWIGFVAIYVSCLMIPGAIRAQGTTPEEICKEIKGILESVQLITFDPSELMPQNSSIFIYDFSAHSEHNIQTIWKDQPGGSLNDIPFKEYSLKERKVRIFENLSLSWRQFIGSSDPEQSLRPGFIWIQGTNSEEGVTTLCKFKASSLGNVWTEKKVPIARFYPNPEKPNSQFKSDPIDLWAGLFYLRSQFEFENIIPKPAEIKYDPLTLRYTGYRLTVDNVITLSGIINDDYREIQALDAIQENNSQVDWHRILKNPEVAWICQLMDVNLVKTNYDFTIEATVNCPAPPLLEFELVASY